MKETQSGVKQQSLGEERSLGGKRDEPSWWKPNDKVGTSAFKGQDKDGEKCALCEDHSSLNTYCLCGGKLEKMH